MKRRRRFGRQRPAQHRAHRHDRLDELDRHGGADAGGGRDVLAAMVYGYEIAGRIDEALTPGRSERGFHGSIATIFAARSRPARSSS